MHSHQPPAIHSPQAIPSTHTNPYHLLLPLYPRPAQTPLLQTTHPYHLPNRRYTALPHRSLLPNTIRSLYQPRPYHALGINFTALL